MPHASMCAHPINMSQLFAAARQHGYVTLQDVETFCDPELVEDVLRKFEAVGVDIVDFPEQEGVHALLVVDEHRWRARLH